MVCPIGCGKRIPASRSISSVISIIKASNKGEKGTLTLDVAIEVYKSIGMISK
ncbi:hypothetical protein B4158_3447 [Bacillus cereus]|nr:hypothetical protein B4158_3447 [Bacillus cereus]